MSSELVQTGFFDIENVQDENPVQVAYDFSKLSPEQADNLQEVYKRIFIRHVTTAYEDGKDLLEAKAIEGLPYKEFIESAKATFGWSERSINNKMNAALYWGDFTAPGAVIEDHAVYLLSSKRVPEPARQEAKALLTAGQNINEELAKELRDKHKALEEANKKAESLEQQALFYQKESELRKSEQDCLRYQLEHLPMPEPEKVIVYQDSPQTQAKMVSLEQKAKREESSRTKAERAAKDFEERFRETQVSNRKIAEENKKLSEEAKRRWIEGQIELDQLRVRQEWRKAVDGYLQLSANFMARVPALINTQAFESDDWSLYAQCIHVTEQTLELLKSIQASQTSQFVDAVIE